MSRLCLGCVVLLCTNRPGKKDSFSIKIAKDKMKLTLHCINDMLCQRWHDALMAGKSGSTARPSGEHPNPRVLVLKAEVEVEEIPECVRFLWVSKTAFYTIICSLSPFLPCVSLLRLL
jgi:hypothetical protein